MAKDFFVSVWAQSSGIGKVVSHIAHIAGHDSMDRTACRITDSVDVNASTQAL